MSRLTKRNGKYVEYSNENYIDSVDNHTMLEKCLSKLAEYEDAEEQGLLLRLPCKVGDTVYYIDDYYVYADKVNSIEIRKENGKYIFCIAYMDYKEEDFGKTVFLTKEEAEKKLESMKGE
jgi:hypothetical protein